MWLSWPGDMALWPGDVALSCNPSYLGGQSSVARSQQAFTATPAQNHGHLATFHGHKIVQNGYIHGHFNKENYLIKGALSQIFYPLFNGLSHLV
jgi:hypothetical protein